MSLFWFLAFRFCLPFSPLLRVFLFFKTPARSKHKMNDVGTRTWKVLFSDFQIPQIEKKKKTGQELLLFDTSGNFKIFKKFLIFLNFWLISVIVATGFHHISTGGGICAVAFIIIVPVLVFFIRPFFFFHPILLLLLPGKKKSTQHPLPPLTFLGFLIWRVEKRFFSLLSSLLFFQFKSFTLQVKKKLKLKKIEIFPKKSIVWKIIQWNSTEFKFF